MVDLMVAVSGGSASSRSRGLQQFAHAPYVVRDPRSHRRGRAERLVDASEVVPAIPEHDRCPMVLPLLRKPVRQSGEPTKAHAKREVRPFHDGCADPLWVGLPHNWDHLHSGYLRRAVSRFAVLGGPVDLDELRVIATVVKRVADCGAVRCKT